MAGRDVVYEGWKNGEKDVLLLLLLLRQETRKKGKRRRIRRRKTGEGKRG